MDLVAVAAFTAAGLSLINVVVSARLSRRRYLEQWRREQEQPIVARILTLSSDAAHEWQEVAAVKFKWAQIFRDEEKRAEADALHQRLREHWVQGQELRKALRYEAAQLDLLAGVPVREVAGELLNAHYGAWHRMRPNGPGETPFRTGEEGKIDELHLRLVERTRADFGIGTAARDRAIAVATVRGRVRPRMTGAAAEGHPAVPVRRLT